MQIKQEYAIMDCELYNSKGQQFKFSTDSINSLHVTLSISETMEEDGTVVDLSIQNLWNLYEFYDTGMKQTIILYWSDDRTQSTTYQCSFTKLSVEDNKSSQDIWFTFRGVLDGIDALSKPVLSQDVSNNEVKSLYEMMRLVFKMTGTEIITDVRDYEYKVNIKGLTYYALIQKYFDPEIFRLRLYQNNLYVFKKTSDIEPMIEILEVDYKWLDKFTIEQTDIEETDTGIENQSYDIPVDYDTGLSEDDYIEPENDGSGYIFVYDVGGEITTVYGRIVTECNGLPGITLGTVLKIKFDPSQKIYEYYKMVGIDGLFIVTEQETNFTWDGGWRQTVYLQHYEQNQDLTV